MIFNIPVAGKIKVMCKFLGAPGETLTFKQNGTIKYTVTENTEQEIKQGVYEVTGGVSGYTKTIEVKAAGTYNAYPDGALFWYGRELMPFRYHVDNGRCSSYNTGSAIYCGSHVSKNNITAYMTDTTNAMTTGKVDTSQYSTIKFTIEPTKFSVVSQSGYTRFYYGYAPSYTYALTSYVNSASSKKTVSVASPKSSTYIGVGTIMEAGANLYGNPGTVEGYCHAIWME
jgi:hypothetical protein